MLVKVIWVIVAFVLVSALWVRFAPSDIEKWHRTINDPRDKDFLSGVIRVVPNAADKLEDVHKAALATPRTVLLAGSVSDKQITYVTRTMFWRFPDYATIWIEKDDLVIYSRQRFGRSDHGVNKAKVEKWLSALPSS